MPFFLEDASIEAILDDEAEEVSNAIDDLAGLNGQTDNELIDMIADLDPEEEYENYEE